MFVGELCNRETIVAPRDAGILEVAGLMRRHHVGSVVVVADLESMKPVGIITDRDLVVTLLADGVDMESVRAGDAMSFELLLAQETEDVPEVLGRMKARGVRRVPVTAGDGRLVGILTVDDLLDFLAEELEGIARLFKREQARELEKRTAA